jgi:hypothetical protein
MGSGLCTGATIIPASSEVTDRIDWLLELPISEVPAIVPGRRCIVEVAARDLVMVVTRELLLAVVVLLELDVLYISSIPTKPVGLPEPTKPPCSDWFSTCTSETPVLDALELDVPPPDVPEP